VAWNLSRFSYLNCGHNCRCAIDIDQANLSCAETTLSHGSRSNPASEGSRCGG
jgi:hypothetical protein